MNLILSNQSLNDVGQFIYLSLMSLFRLCGRLLFACLPVLALFLPSLVFADAISPDSSSLNFKPPPGDVSIVFLGNIFGVVDGVLAGTGSQIVGQMFGVFNSSVLALGGILITYTLMVSTLNTAQEGQVLGRQWSSIWVPLRSIGGVVLLLPKASGYCLMQIFVMWVVVQGVGAADKVWAQALSYLNRGGAIVKPNVDPVTRATQSGGDAVINGAYGMLAGQVCMLGLEQMMNDYHADVLQNARDNQQGICHEPSDAGIKTFCTTSVPYFIDSVNFVSDDILNSAGYANSRPTVKMPNFSIEPYSGLNGACGAITFNNYNTNTASPTRSETVVRGDESGNFISKTLGGMSTGYQGLKNKAVGFWGDNNEEFEKNWVDLRDNVTGGLSDAWENTKEGLNKAWNKVKESPDFFKKLPGKALSGLKSAASSTLEQLKKSPELAKQFFEQLPDNAKKSWEEAKEQAGGLPDKLEDLPANVRDQLLKLAASAHDLPDDIKRQVLRASDALNAPRERTGINAATSTLTNSETKKLNQSRAVALNQMFISLQGTAQAIIRNSADFNNGLDCSQAGVNCVNGNSALYHFGVPVTLGLSECKAYANPYQEGCSQGGEDVFDTLSGAACVLDSGGAVDAGWNALTSGNTDQMARTTMGFYNAGSNAGKEHFGIDAGGFGEFGDQGAQSAAANTINKWIGDDSNAFAGGYKPGACLRWDLVGGAVSPILFGGTEIKDAISTYNGMMSATLYIMSQGANAEDYNKQRAFIRKSEQQGWLLAGAYYFRLAILTSQVLQTTAGSNSTDQHSGIKICSPTSLEGECPTPWSVGNIKDFFTNCRQWGGINAYKKQLFCGQSQFPNSFYNNRASNKFTSLDALIKGPNTTQQAIPTFSANLAQPIYGAGDPSQSYKDPDSVYGLIINETAVVTPGQPGDKMPTFTFKMTYSASTNIPELGNQSMGGGFMGIPGQVITKIFNSVVKHFFNFIVALVTPLANMIFFAFISPPMALMTSVFVGAMEVMKNPAVNPILALANMGVGFIEGVSNSWINMIGIAVGAAAIGLAAIGLLMILLPLVTCWLGVMFGIGCTCLYYVPMMPFLVFLFASIGWLIGVIEAMVAAPIVALGLMHPEGNDAFGKGDQAIMLLMSTFLRPPMMILGYIFGIILSYVGIWYMNAGFEIVIPQIEKMPMIGASGALNEAQGDILSKNWASSISQAVTGDTSTYGMWSTIFLIIFEMIIYTMSLVVIVNKSFELIHYLPDKILRWIGGGGEALGQTAMSGLKDVKAQHEKGAKASSGAVAKFNSAMMQKTLGAAKSAGSEESGESGGEAAAGKGGASTAGGSAGGGAGGGASGLGSKAKSLGSALKGSMKDGDDADSAIDKAVDSVLGEDSAVGKVAKKVIKAAVGASSGGGSDGAAGNAMMQAMEGMTEEDQSAIQKVAQQMGGDKAGAAVGQMMKAWKGMK